MDNDQQNKDAGGPSDPFKGVSFDPHEAASKAAIATLRDRENTSTSGNGIGSADQSERLSNLGGYQKPIAGSSTPGGVYDRPGNDSSSGNGGSGQSTSGVNGGGNFIDNLKRAENAVPNQLKKKEKENAGEFAKDAAKVGAALAGGNGLKGALEGIKTIGKHRKKQGIIIGIVGAFIIGAIIAAAVLTLPLQLMGVTTNLQKIFFASVEDATNRMDDNLIRHYLIKKVVPGMVKNRCTTTRADKSCADVADGGNIVTQMYRAWRDANLEGELAKEHGIEIRRVGNRFYLRTPQISEGLDLGVYEEGNTRNFENKLFAELSRSQARAQLRIALDQITRRNHFFFNRSVLRVADRKYGIRACGIVTIKCKGLDKVDDIKDSINERKNAGKIRLSERVLLPHSEAAHLAYTCSLSGFTCTELGEANSDGERLSDFDKSVRAKYQEYRSKHGEKSLKELDKNALEIRKNGYGNYVIKRIAGETAAKIGGKFIPIFGQVSMAAEAVVIADKAGPAIRRMNYVMNSSAFVAVFAMLRTAGDEVKTGNVDPVMLGSVTELLSEVEGADQGGRAAEASPLYGKIFTEPDASGQVVTIDPTPKAYAAESNVPLCDNGKPYPKDELVCPELTTKAESPTGNVLNMLSDANKFISGPGIYTSGAFVTAWNAIINFLIEYTVPGLIYQFVIDRMTEAFADDLKPVLDWLREVVNKQLFVVPDMDNPGGTRTIEMATAGVDVLANSVGSEIGGKTLTSYELDVLNSSISADRQERFKNLALRDKLFNTDEIDSVATKLGVAMSASNGSIAGQFASLATGFARITASGLATAFAPRTVAAANVPADSTYNAKYRPNPDPFGYVQNGYNTKHSAFRIDPETNYDTLECSAPDNYKKWGDKATYIEEYSQEALHREENPCMLIRDRASSMGGKYDTSLLLPVSTSTAPATPETDPGGGGVGSADGWTFPLVTTQAAIKKGHKGVWCYDKQTNCHHDYQAADIMIGEGTKVIAARPGIIITKTGNTEECTGRILGYPRMQIKGDDGNYYFYAHFKPGSLTSKGTGDHVDAGEPLGIIGADNCGQGASHLHIQWYNSIINGSGEATNIQPPLVKAFNALPTGGGASPL